MMFTAHDDGRCSLSFESVEDTQTLAVMVLLVQHVLGQTPREPAGSSQVSWTMTMEQYMLLLTGLAGRLDKKELSPEEMAELVTIRLQLLDHLRDDVIAHITPNH